MHKKLAAAVLVVLLIVVPCSLSAREGGNLSLGVQAGFLATGIVADVQLGPFSLNSGVN